MRVAALAVIGAILFAVAIAIASAPEDATVVLPALALGALAYLGVIAILGESTGDSPLSRWSVGAAVGFGLAMRLVLIASPPVLEDDVNRYLWDGAVLAAGTSPYAFSPQEIYATRVGRGQPGFSSEERDQLQRLAELSQRAALEAAFLAINYPVVPTIYPPVAQLMFVALSTVRPGSVSAMKIALVTLDAITAIALVLILLSIGVSPWRALLYWWNPLIVLSFAGSAHMDALAMALFTVAIALALRARGTASGLVLGVAAASKLFPLVCLPAMSRQLKWRGVAVACATTLAFYGLLWHARMFEGLVTFAEVWKINGAIHPLVSAVVGDGWARRIGLALVATVAIAVHRRDLLVAISWTLAALVLASPAINPWYVAWLVPVAAARRSLPLLVLSVTVLGSYVRFLTIELPAWLPIIEFGVPLGLAIGLAARARRARTPARTNH